MPTALPDSEINFTPPKTGQLAANIMQFCRTLRAAGLPIGPGKVLTAIEAATTVGVADRTDFYWALHSALINRRDQREIFDQVFHIFWRNPDILRRAMSLLLPTVDPDPRSNHGEPIQKRVADAIRKEEASPRGTDDEDEPPTVELDARLTFSAKEKLASKDFEQMSAEEIAAAKKAIAALRLPIPAVRTRRFQPTSRIDRVDPRRTLRRSLRGGGAIIDIAHRHRIHRPPPLVVLCDISGSMSQYSRMLLHFLHAITSDRDRVHSFVFGTRLTNITRPLRHRDVDLALGKIGESVQDWSGGTRIGACLHDFNRHWSRRVLAQGAVVLLITDGLDRDTGEALDREMERLQKSCRSLLWLNPLLRYEGFAPKSIGARAIVRHVDAMLPAHNLDSLESLVEALSGDQRHLGTDMRDWRARAEG